MRPVISSPAAAVGDGGPGHADIADLVAQAERIDALTPLAIMPFFIGTPLVTGLLRGHPVVAAINAVLPGFVDTVVVRIT